MAFKPFVLPVSVDLTKPGPPLSAPTAAMRASVSDSFMKLSKVTIQGSVETTTGPNSGHLVENPSNSECKSPAARAGVVLKKYG